MKKNLSILSAVIVLLGTTVAGFLYTTNRDIEPEASDTAQTVTENDLNSLDEAPVIGASLPPTTESLLLYLIEEEKLAHDVYTVMYELYGARVFGNILNSESTHQSRVLTLLNARSIADPRSSELGVFKDPALQALYDQLIAQGKVSETEAFKVGVAIEEKDIADISTQLATASDTDVITTLEDLRRGSENHLRAFSRQL